MNKITRCYSLLLTLLFIGSFAVVKSQSQSAASIEGRWEGVLTLGANSLRIVFHFESAGEGYTGTMDSPDQGQNGIPCQNVVLEGDSLSLNVMNVIDYHGKQTDSTHITGNFAQNGMELLLNLEKKDASDTTAVKRNQSQTPKPPFSYLTKDVIYQSPDKKLQYGATITMPDSTGNFPAILLITGSGPQNRNEETAGHQPFAVLADYLTKAGYLVMRVDDRGVGKSTGVISESTTLDFADDVNRSIDYLKQLPQVNKKEIGLLGHSEGGLIAEIVAAKRKDIDFIILMAAPGIPIVKLMELQRMAVANKNMSKDVRAYDSTRFHLFAKAVLSSKDTAAIRTKMLKNAKRLQKKSAAGFLPKTAAERDAMAKKVVGVYFNLMVADPWMNNFLRMDPQPYLRQLSCKVLALNGSRDIQVLPEENLAGIKKSLAAGKSKTFDVVELPGLNHLFQECKECTVKEYGQLEQTLAPALLNKIGGWLKNNVPIHAQ